MRVLWCFVMAGCFAACGNGGAPDASIESGAADLAAQQIADAAMAMDDDLSAPMGQPMDAGVRGPDDGQVGDFGTLPRTFDMMFCGPGGEGDGRCWRDWCICDHKCLKNFPDMIWFTPICRVKEILGTKCPDPGFECDYYWYVLRCSQDGIVEGVKGLQACDGGR